MLVGIPSHEVAARWPVCEALLAPALERTHGLITPESVLSACRARDAQLWEVRDGDAPIAALVTEVRNLRSGIRTVHVFALGGSGFVEIMKHEPDLMQWARVVGASKLTMDGRRGWTKKLDSWKEVSVMMEKDVA